MSYIFQDGQMKNLEIVLDNARDHLTGIVGRYPTVRSHVVLVSGGLFRMSK